MIWDHSLFFCLSPLARAYLSWNKGWPYCTGLPSSAITRAIMPLVSALISFITFIASMMHTTVFASTWSPTVTKDFSPGEDER